MENEPNIFEQAAAQSVQPVQPGQEGQTAAPKKKTGLIIGIVVGALVLIGAIVAVVLVLVLGGKPDYEQMGKAVSSVREIDLDSEMSSLDVENLAEGNLSKVSHDRTVKDAREAVSTLRNYADKVDASVKDLEKAGIAKDEKTKKHFDEYKKQAENMTPKMRSMANDLEKYIEFGEKYYNSALKGIDTGDYEALATLKDSEIDAIFEPLMNVESKALKELGEAMSEMVKVLAQFYAKYADYMDGTKEVTAEIRDQVLADMEAVEAKQDELGDKINSMDMNDIFELKEEDVANFEKALDKLNEVIDEQLDI